jgi:hypothetical protein
MQVIYQRAARVLIWLGDGHVNDSLAIRILERLGGNKKYHAEFRKWEMGHIHDWYGPQFEGNLIPDRVGRTFA